MNNKSPTNRPDFVTHAGTESVLMWETDAERRCNYFSDAYLEFTGLSFTDMEGDGWTRIVHPDDLPLLLQVSSKAFERRLPFSLEARFHRQDGVYRWFLNVGVPKYSQNGEFIGYAGTNFDISQTKQIELARAEEQIRFRNILEHSPTMIAMLDTQLNYIYTNGPYATYWNETPESLVGRNALQFTSGETSPQTEQRFEDAKNGQTVSFKHEATRDGIEHTLLVKYIANWDAEGEHCGYYVFADDVTTLREKEKHFELILNNLPARVAYFNRRLELQYGNRALYQHLGRKPEEIEGKPLPDVIGQVAFEAAEPFFVRAMNGHTAVYEQAEMSGHSLVYLVPNMNAKQQTIGIFSLELDVSPLKRAEAQLRRSDRQFELAMQGSQVGFWETEIGRHEEFFTENIESLLGLPAGKLGNSREAFYRRVHPDDIETVRQTDQRQLVEPGSHVAEYRLLMADDRYKWFRSVGETEQDANGNYVRSAGTIANIDELKKAELEAEAQVRNRDVFLSMLSHELRNPLAAIQFAVDFCRDSGSLSPEHKPMFDIIARQTEQTSRMLTDLLDVTRVTGNRLLFEKEYLDLTELLESTASATQHIFETKKQTFDIEIQSGLMTFGDGVRLHQAFANLLDNACKYSPEHATIHFSAKLVETSLKGNDHWSSSAEIHAEELLVVRIADDGQGIAPTDQENIFDLFFQEQRSIDRSSGGLGLGLFLVREIVIAHGGSVSVSSDGEGMGSTFEIHLLPSSRLALNLPQKHLPDLAPCKIVLIEDNRDARLALKHSLTARGCEVVTYADGAEAYQQLPSDAPDFAIVDIGLPKKNGLQLATELRHVPSLRNTTFIALTGYGQSSDQREIAAAGFEAHVVKPVDLRQLLQMIAERHLRRPNPCHPDSSVPNR